MLQLALLLRYVRIFLSCLVSLSVQFSGTVNEFQFAACNRNRYNFHKVNCIKIYKDLAHIDQSFLQDFYNVDHEACEFCVNIYSIFDRFLSKYYSLEQNFTLQLSHEIQCDLKMKNYYHKNGNKLIICISKINPKYVLRNIYLYLNMDAWTLQ